MLSRIHNIGYEMGENDRTPERHRANHRTPWVASQMDIRGFELHSNPFGKNALRDRPRVSLLRSIMQTNVR